VTNEFFRIGRIRFATTGYSLTSRGISILNGNVVIKRRGESHTHVHSLSHRPCMHAAAALSIALAYMHAGGRRWACASWA